MSHGKWERQMGMLVLDDDAPTELPEIGKAPGTYVRLAGDHSYKAKFGYKPIWHETRWCFPNASRYVRMFQSRRSLLVWKILGRRTDGWTNDDHPTETVPGDPATLQWHGKPLAPTGENITRADIDYTGSIMRRRRRLLERSALRTAQKSKSSRSPTKTSARSSVGSTLAARSSSTTTHNIPKFAATDG